MKKWSVLACGLLALVVSAAHAETDNKSLQPSLQLDCRRFTPLPNGYWASGPDAKVNGAVFSNNVFGRRGFRFNGVDVAEELDRQCRGTRS
jgi:hypothetical protein